MFKYSWLAQAMLDFQFAEQYCDTLEKWPKSAEFESSCPALEYTLYKHTERVVCLIN